MNVAKARCVEVDCKRKRSMLAKFRGGTAKLRIETGRFCPLEPCPLRTVLPDCRDSVDYNILRCEILERGGRLVGVIPSADACILA